jgi:hypothetical protein
MAQAGAGNLAQNSPEVSTTVAFSMLNEYGLKLENKAAAARCAVEELVNTQPLNDEAPDAEISADWLNYFSDIAAQKSDPEMQRLMGRILAGEIRKPGSFSPMTISVLSTLTPVVAQRFELLCSVALEEQDACLILKSIFPQFEAKGIPEIGFTYIDFLALRQHQLLATDQGSTLEIDSGEEFIVSNCGQRFILGSSGAQQIQCALFSQVGVEMRRLVSPKAVPWFIEKLSATFSQPNWRLQPIV